MLTALHFIVGLVVGWILCGLLIVLVWELLGERGNLAWCIGIQDLGAIICGIWMAFWGRKKSDISR